MPVLAENGDTLESEDGREILAESESTPMAGNITLKQGTTTATVTSGGSLADGFAVAANTVKNLTNSTQLDETVTARLVGATGSAPAQGTKVSLYLVPLSDGTNAGGVDTSTPNFNPAYLAGFFYWPAASSASSQKMDIDGIPVSALDYAPYLVNNLGQTLSSGWTLTFYGTTRQYT